MNKGLSQSPSSRAGRVNTFADFGTDSKSSKQTLWDAISYQSSARSALQLALKNPVHAYLLLGPRGVGKEEIAKIFAVSLLCEFGGCAKCENCTLGMKDKHPDLVVVERIGNAISVGQAREVSAFSMGHPRIARKLVVVLTDFELVDEAAPALLKTVEEPPGETVFIILAEAVTPKLVTIASRCVEIRFNRLSNEEIITLLESEGIDGEKARRAVSVSQGRIDFAKRAIEDEAFVRLFELFRSAPLEVRSNGSSITSYSRRLIESIDQALEELVSRQEEEVKNNGELVKIGHSQISKADIAQRHKREQRRERTELLQSGLAIMANYYGELLAQNVDSIDGGGTRAKIIDAVRAVELIDATSSFLDRNPNEAMLVEALLTRLSGLYR